MDSLAISDSCPIVPVCMYAALDVEPVLNMLVFGESILNDAVAIVLTTTIIGGHTSQKNTDILL